MDENAEKGKAMLSERDLARLANTLEIPMVVQDILDGGTLLAPEIRYGLHEVMSNYQPDAALLCMVLAGRKIAMRCLKRHGARNFSGMAVLKMECDRLIEDYAELWMDHAGRRPVDDNLLFDTLTQIPEDLESMAELLEMNAALLRSRGEREDMATICEILAIQGRAQTLIADAFVEAMERSETVPEPLTIVAANVGDNVIAFPMRSARG